MYSYVYIYYLIHVLALLTPPTVQLQCSDLATKKSYTSTSGVSGRTDLVNIAMSIYVQYSDVNIMFVLSL